MTRQIWVNIDTGERFDTRNMDHKSINPATNRFDPRLFNIGIPCQIDALIDNKIYRRKYLAMIKRGELRYLLALAERAADKDKPSHYFATCAKKINWPNTKNAILQAGSYRKFRSDGEEKYSMDPDFPMINEDPPIGSETGPADPQPYRRRSIGSSESQVPDSGLRAPGPDSRDVDPPGSEHLVRFWRNTDFPSPIRRESVSDGIRVTTSWPGPNSILRDDYDGCIIWQGLTDDDGYGLFKADGKLRMAHRWIFEQENGPLPPEIEVDHTCDTRPCVNTRHHKAVTKAANLARRRIRRSRG